MDKHYAQQGFANTIQQGGANTILPTSLTRDASVALDRLEIVRTRIAGLAGQLNGHRPMPDGTEGKAEQGSPPLRLTLDRIAGVLQGIEAELEGIETRL